MEYIESVSPHTAWQDAPAFFWLRKRGITLAGVIDGIVGLVVGLGLGPVLGTAVTVAGLGLVIGLYYRREYYIKEARACDRWHKICHHLRDQAQRVVETALIDDSVPERKIRYVERYQRFMDDTVERIAEFFRALTDDQEVNCALRLAEKRSDGMVYATVARSKGMHEGRKTESQAIPYDQGIAQALRTRKQKGVIIIRDIPAEISDGNWHQCASDRFSDVKTLMIAPVNGFESISKSMLGMLYITAPDDPFRRMHTESLKAAADLLGLVLPTITGLPGILGTNSEDNNNVG